MQGAVSVLDPDRRGCAEGTAPHVSPPHRRSVSPQIASRQFWAPSPAGSGTEEDGMESRDRRGRVRVAASVAAGLPLILVVVYGPARAEAHPGAETATGTVELDGKLRVIVEDAQHSSRTLYFLDTGSERLPLHFKSNPPTGFLTGQGVHVTGRRTDDTVEVPSGDSGIQPMTLPCCTSNTRAMSTPFLQLIVRLELKELSVGTLHRPGWMGP